MDVEVKVNGCSKQYMVMFCGTAVHRTYSATEARDYAEALIGRARTAEVINKQLQAYADMEGLK